MDSITASNKFYDLPEAEQRLPDVSIPMSIIDALNGTTAAPGHRNETIAYNCRVALNNSRLQTPAFRGWIEEIKTAAENGEFRE